MRKKLTLLTVVVVFMFTLAVLGCSNAGEPSGTTNSDTSGGTSIAAWGEKYPLQYASFYSDYDLPKVDGLVNSHANHDAKMARFAGFSSTEQVMELGAIARCYACKTSEFNAIYSTHGEASLSMPIFDDQVGISDQVETWNCSTCHLSQDDPAGSLGTNTVLWNTVSGDFGKKLDANTAVCAQCHNAVYPLNFMPAFEGYNLYKYGIDADAWFKATWESARLEDYYDELFINIPDYPVTRNEETKILTFAITHPDVEMFQGSAHQSLGLTCVSCHMTKTTDTSGENYTRHAASMSPLASSSTLEFCLSCHKSQGINSAKEMVTWVREKQSALAERDKELVEKLATLEALIADATRQGNMSEDILDQARMAHTMGELYYRWQQRPSSTAGVMAPVYGSSNMLQYINRGMQEIETGIALFD
jgi:nitrite reductase (cytochrome c-552)